MFNFLLTDTAAEAGNQWWIYLVMIGLVVVMLVLPSISNKKRAKEYNNMIDNLSVGDTVRTVGGIIGKISKINNKDGYKTFILETGAKGSKTTMEFDIASIYTVLNSKNAPAVKEEPKAEEPKPEEKVEEVKEEPKAEVVEEPKAEEKKPAKKSAKKSK